jgi:hypothetical protein
MSLISLVNLLIVVGSCEVHGAMIHGGTVHGGIVHGG